MNRLPRALLILSVTAAMGCTVQKAASDAPGAPPNPIDVRVARVRAGTMPLVAEGFGSLIVPPNHTASVASVSGGRVLSLRARLGDRVQAGAVLVELQPDPAARSDREKARIAFVQAKRERDRQQALVKAGVSARMRLDDAQSAYDQAAADLALKRAAVELCERNTKLRSPISGVVTEASVSVGMVLSPQASAFTVSDLAALWADVAVPAGSLGRVRSEMRAEVVLDGGGTLPGRVTVVERALSPDTQRGTVRIALASTGSLAPGAFVRARIVTGEQKGVLVPTPALIVREGYREVFVVEGGKAHARRVQVAQEAGPTALVTRGLAAGEQVVTMGSYELSNGSLVRPVASRQP